MTDLLDLEFTTEPGAPPAGDSDRFGGRWRLVGAGLFDVWRFGHLDLPAASGRLLLRGPNGTGKTTALEALWPYLLDLNAAKLAAGKSRPTSLKLLMSEGAPPKGRRYGYAWLTFAVPDSEIDPSLPADTGWTGAPGEANPPHTLRSYGVRLQYGPNSTPAVRVVPFTVPGRPGNELPLRNPAGTAMESEEFSQAVSDAGGTVFDSPEEYVEDIARTVWSTGPADLIALAARLREVRNPQLLADISPANAAAALRQSLPGVDPDVLAATADALAESEQTREAFERDKRAAEVLGEFERVWTGHVVDVAQAAYTRAADAATTLGAREKDAATLRTALSRATSDEIAANQQLFDLQRRKSAADATASAIAESDAYRAHGRVVDLRRRLTAEQGTAAAGLEALHSAAARARRQTTDGQANLSEQLEELADELAAAAQAGAASVPVEAIASQQSRPRTTRRVGDHIINPGPGVTVHLDTDELHTVAATWHALAEHSRAEVGRAKMLRTEFNEVAAAEKRADKSSQAARQAADRYDEARQLADQSAREAAEGSTVLLTDLRRWAEENPALRGMTSRPSPCTPVVDTDEPSAGAAPDGSTLVWDIADIDELDGAEPATVIVGADRWADLTVRTAEAAAARHETIARAHDADATANLETATELRDRARGLREGKLVPLPRPDWAGPGDDEHALGAALEWREGCSDPDQQDRIELALSAAGVLGARLDPDAVTTDAWVVTADAAPLPEHDSLAAVLEVDPANPHAHAAHSVLAAIGLADTAHTADTAATSDVAANQASALRIGRDGTFTAGPLTGRPLSITSEGELPHASHIGARARQRAARELADGLDREAAGLEAAATVSRRIAERERELATAVRAAASTFPDRGPLRTLEAARAGSAAAANRLDDQAQQAQRAAETDRAAHAHRHSQWVTHARDLGMPADDTLLADVISTATGRADALNRSAKRLVDKLLARILRAMSALPDEADLNTQLTRAEQHARTCAGVVEATTALLRETQSVGDVDDAVERFHRARAEADHLDEQLAIARDELSGTQQRVATKRAEVAAAEQQVRDVLPQQAATEAHLQRLLTCKPVAAVLSVSDHEAARGPLGAGDELLEGVDVLLAGRATYSRKTLNERYDTVRTDVSRTWTIAREEPLPDLDLEMFVLTHGEASYDPHQAAARAADAASRAGKALDNDEARALDDYVIGRLPAAIGTAWAELIAWRKSVNAKMRSAQASSGVGVQVDVAVRDDLDATTRVVYELACQVGDAVRSDEQKAQVGEALMTLLAGADGETMTERLAAAVDIREWVDVHYLVERPGHTPRRWGSRTGLSGGERRLVVLAPMLAAVAANYDRLKPTGLRLVALDEVPAEVDEAGRQGLARFIAELELDVMCTSYLWDGAPGAWDGIDAHDLEAGPDGTVVAFPTIVRGKDGLPGDTLLLTDLTDDGGGGSVASGPDAAGPGSV